MANQIVIIGGGAAGFFCAANIHAPSDTNIILLERSQKFLSKVRISGGGRCNVTHNMDSISRMIKCYPRGGQFLKKAFARFFVPDTIEWFAQRGVSLKVEPDGRMFPITDNSETIASALMRAAIDNNVQLRLGQHVTTVKPEGNQFVISIKGHKDIWADKVVIAAGGLPKLDMFDWLAPLGHTIVPPVPSLFTFKIPRHPITQLMGLSVPYASVKILGTKLQTEGPVLITHWGLSGPAVLKASAYGALELAASNYEFLAQVNWLAHFNEDSFREHLQQYRIEHPSQRIHNYSAQPLPKRLWAMFLMLAEIDSELRWADLPAKQLNKLAKLVTALQLQVSGKSTFKDEFVTAGGVQLTEIDGHTMQSKLHPGVYFAGEIMNIDGITGGFNFQNAWTSGFIAARSCSQ